MAEYKRKKFKKSASHKKDRKELDGNIPMKSQKEKISKGIVPEQEIKVIRGAKYARSLRNKFLFSFIAVVAVIALLLHMILPVGIYESIVNTSAIIGHGKYPIDLSGADVVDCVSHGQYYYVLTDTSISAYSNGGKLIFTDMHGFANPVLSTSQTRAAVYDQGGKLLYVYNLSGRIHKLESENEIICSSISRNGLLAVTTQSDSYASVVNVYDKDLKQIYTWNSAKDIVNNALVNPSGNRLAVTTFNAVAGQYISKLYILSFDSADPLYTADLGGSLALSLINTGKGLSVIMHNSYKFVHWKKFNTNDITASGEINIVRKGDNGLLLVFNRANDRSDNTVVFVSDKGVKIGEVGIKGLITDIQYNKGRIYYISDTVVTILDGKGNVLRYAECDYGAKKFAVISSNSTAVVTDSEIVKIDIEKGEG